MYWALLPDPEGDDGREPGADRAVAARVLPPADPPVLGALEGVEQVQGAAADVGGVVQVAGGDEGRDLRALRALGEVADAPEGQLLDLEVFADT